MYLGSVCPGDGLCLLLNFLGNPPPRHGTLGVGNSRDMGISSVGMPRDLSKRGTHHLPELGHNGILSANG